MSFSFIQKFIFLFFFSKIYIYSVNSHGDEKTIFEDWWKIKTDFHLNHTLDPLLPTVVIMKSIWKDTVDKYRKQWLHYIHRCGVHFSYNAIEIAYHFHNSITNYNPARKKCCWLSLCGPDNCELKLAYLRHLINHTPRKQKFHLKKKLKQTYAEIWNFSNWNLINIHVYFQEPFLQILSHFPCWNPMNVQHLKLKM